MAAARFVQACLVFLVSSSQIEIRKPRIYVGIPTNWPITKENTKKNLRSLIDTWGSKVDILRIYVHHKQLEKFPASTSGIDGIEKYLESIPMKRTDKLSHRNIWEKMWRSWLRASQLYLDDADWFMKADIDSFLVVDNIRAFLSHLDPNDPHYLGHTLMHEWDKFNLVFNSGVGYILSRETLRRYGYRLSLGMTEVGIQEKKYQCYDRGGPLEDPNTGGCLRELNILPGDTLDNEGRQRFNLFRPRDLLFRMTYKPEDWYWKNKMSIGKKQLGFGCCSSLPLVWHNFKSGKGVFDEHAFQELDYVFASQSYESRLAGFNVEAPSGTLYQFREDELSFKVDADRNALLDKHKEDVKVGRYIRDHPETAECFKSGSTCSCTLPIELPTGMTSTDCENEQTLGHGTSCRMTCKPGYRMEISAHDQQKGFSPGNGLRTSFKCEGGHLHHPRFTCNAICTVPEEQTTIVFHEKAGYEYSHGDKLEVRCKKDPFISIETRCSHGKFRGKIGRCLGPCFSISLSLKGSEYQMEDWATITHIGQKSEEFFVESVATGSSRDTSNNCHIYNIDTQLILVTQPEGLEKYDVTALSCGNQEISIKDKQISSAEVECPEIPF
mmetsp:Transcript_18126/g.27188  ORF Transcript_18126/g.27188 Transcript_18126/m.27188 type:complete len:610 (+) Transcript_18126:32-1861(+)